MWRVRLRTPSGQATLQIASTATVADLISSISQKSSLSTWTAKTGYPPQPLALHELEPAWTLEDAGLRLNGETLVIVSNEPTGPLPEPSAAQDPTANGSNAAQRPQQTPRQDQPLSLTRAPNDITIEPPELPFASHQGTLVLRVMPDDNSCMFRALASAVMGDLDAMHELRSMVATTIQNDKETYNKAMLDNKEPDRYCRWIQNPDSWGGGIELSILSKAFDIEIASINVQDLRVDRFNENPGTKQRCILVYSGIHYDVIALNPSPPPYTSATADAEFDQKQFNSTDDEILARALDLCKILQGRHYYTDTAAFDLKCEQCGWIGKGEVGAQQHAGETGHYQFGEAK